MPESAFREHWPPALRLRSLCGIEKGVARAAGMKEGGTSNRFRRTQPPRARLYWRAAAAGRSDVPNEYQQAQPPPLPPLLFLSLSPVRSLFLLLSISPSRRTVGERILFPRAWRARERLLGFRFSCPPHRQLLFRTPAMADRSPGERRRRRREFSQRDDTVCHRATNVALGYVIPVVRCLVAIFYGDKIILSVDSHTSRARLRRSIRHGCE